MKSLCFFFIYFAEAIILFLYGEKVFSKRFSRASYTASLYICIYGILYAISFFNNPYINLASFVVLNYICIRIAYKDSLWNILFHLFIITIAMLATEVSTLAIFSNIANSLFFDEAINNISLLLASLISKLLYFLITYVVAIVLKHKGTAPNPNLIESLILVCIPILSIWIFVTFLTISIYYSSMPFNISVMLLISAFFILIINLITFGIYEYLGKKNAAFTDMQLQIQKEIDYAEYYKMLLEQDENQKILIHDINKHLKAISILSDAGEIEKINSYLDNVLSSPALQPSINVSNHDFLNAILAHYKREADKYNIAIAFDIRKHCIDFLPDDNITTLFCNLLDNAIESAKQTTEPFIELTATKNDNTNYTIITAQNSCATNPFQGDSKNVIKHIKDSKRHGFGLKSVQKIVDLYDGKMNYFFDESTHTFHTIIAITNTGFPQTKKYN